MSTTLVEPSGSSESAEAKAKPEPKAGNGSSSVPSTKSRQEQLLATSKTLAAGLSLDHLFANVVEKTRT